MNRIFLPNPRKIRMHVRRLPIAPIVLLTIGIFFTAATFVFAQHAKPQSNNKKILAIHTKPTLSPKNKPSPTPTISQTITKHGKSPTPAIPTIVEGIGGIINTPIPTSAPAKAPTTAPTTILTLNAPSGGSLLDQVNAYRASQGLGPVQTSNDTCNFAATRAQEISSNFSHDGFNSRLSNHTLPYAHWTAVTENIAQTPNPQNVVPMWINSPGHAANMRADTPYVCIQQNGQYFAYEGMKP